jgi:suppressor for copper-sensitivity B
MTRSIFGFLVALVSTVWTSVAYGEVSGSYENPAVSARLISVENGVAPNAATLSLGLDIQLGDGWKAYWRSPGEVGLPPEIDWAGSQNLLNAELLWPAPERFTAFGIENFGYHDQVVLPIRVQVLKAGEPVSLEARVTLLTCKEICVPHDFQLRLYVPAGTGIDSQMAELVTDFVKRIPLTPSESDIRVESATLTDEALIVTASSDRPFNDPDVFPEMGPRFTFGAPDIRTNAAGTEMWAQLPLLARNDTPTPLRVTLTDGLRAVTAEPEWSRNAPKPPFLLVRNMPNFIQTLTIAALAFLGGFILNAMPCVLPVLSIKLASALNYAGKTTREVRKGFLITALGVLSFMWVLSIGILVLQFFGVNVGWGLQFQSPAFLSIMLLVLVVFSANLFGVFEISLPSSFQTRLANSGQRAGYAGDFATGAFAAVLATPCSAPFLGTAVAFALAGRPIDVLIVFTALGLGLALPYLVFAWKPGLFRIIPKPGRWMIWVKWILGLLLVATALWLFWVLNGVAGIWTAGMVLVLTLVFVVIATVPMSRNSVRGAALSLIAVLGVFTANGSVPTPVMAERNLDQNWVVFDRGEISRMISQGQVVFVDVTADWCLTCKANKALVLDRSPVADLLSEEGVVAMQADWTRPNAEISRYLESHDRFGIPFNIVYGPSAPDGIVLSEVLTTNAVLGALEAAQ